MLRGGQAQLQPRSDGRALRVLELQTVSCLPWVKKIPAFLDNHQSNQQLYYILRYIKITKKTNNSCCRKQTSAAPGGVGLLNQGVRASVLHIFASFISYISSYTPRIATKSDSNNA